MCLSFLERFPSHDLVSLDCHRKDGDEVSAQDRSPDTLVECNAVLGSCQTFGIHANFEFIRENNLWS
jgi:hypothetical protein